MPRRLEKARAEGQVPRSTELSTSLVLLTALGASRWRIVSQLLAESLVLSVIGSLIGIVIAWLAGLI